MFLAVSMIPVGIIGGIEGFQTASILLIALILAVTFIVSLLISYLIAKPIENLTKDINMISKGQLDVKTKNSEIHEINNLTESFNRIMASLKLAVHKCGMPQDEIFEEPNLRPSEQVNIPPVEKLNEKWSEHEFDSVFVFDENANIVDCNDNMYKKLGYSKSEMLALNMADFDALESKKDIVNKINLTKQNGAISFKTIHKRKDGSAVLVHENLQYLKDKNEFRGIVREDYSLKNSQ
jgi:PAS domain S-box-containing protein